MASDQPPRNTKLTRSEWRVILLLASINFTHIIDFVIIMPLGDRLMDELKIGPWQFSNIVSSYGLAAGIASLLASFFMDRFDRKRVLLTMYAGFALSTLLCGWAPNYELLLVARTLAGVFGGVAATALMAVIGDVFPAERRGTATGAVMSAFAVASIVGLPIGLALANGFGRSAPFTALAGLSACVWVMVAVLLPPIRGHLGAPRREPFAEFVDVAYKPRHLKAFVFTASVVFGSFTVIPFIGPYMTANAGRSEADLPLIYAVAGGCTLVSMNLIGKLADRFSRKWLFRVIASGAIAMALVTTNLPSVSLFVAILTCTLFMVFASGRMVPAQAMIIGCALPRQRGAFMSMNTAVQHFTTGVAPMISGALMTKNEDGTLSGYPLVGLAAAGFALVSLVLVGFLRPAEVSGESLEATKVEDKPGEEVVAVQEESHRDELRADDAEDAVDRPVAEAVRR